VYRAEGLDGDDVVAKLAQELGPKTMLLSADRDMFRYVGLDNPADRVMADFTFDPVDVQGRREHHDAHADAHADIGYRLRLIPSHNPTRRRGVSKRWLSEVPYDPEAWLMTSNKLTAGIRNDMSDVADADVASRTGVGRDLGHKKAGTNEDCKQPKKTKTSSRPLSTPPAGLPSKPRRRRRRPSAPVPVHAMVRRPCTPALRLKPLCVHVDP
jgi:hypothetical protein